MGLPILNDLNAEITRLNIAGSPLARNDPRLKKFLPPLAALGEKAPVFKALAERLAALVEGDKGNDKTSPENLMETGMLLQSLRYAQASVETGQETVPASYPETPLAVGRTPYSELSEIIELLSANSAKETPLRKLKTLFSSGGYRDPRLFRAYSSAITDNRTPISNYVAGTLIPALGTEMIPFLEEALDLKGGKRDARLFRILYDLKGRDILPLAEAALKESGPPLLFEAIRALGEDARYEETLLVHAKARKAEARTAALAALARIGTEKGDALILAEMEKPDVRILEEALTLTRNPAIVRKVLEKAQALNPEVKKKGFLDGLLGKKETPDEPAWAGDAERIKVWLRVLAQRDEPEGLAFLGRVLMPGFYEAEYFRLELEAVIQLLLKGDVPARLECVYRLPAFHGKRSYARARLHAAVKLRPAAEVFEKFKDMLAGSVTLAYDIDFDSEPPPDAQKTWDPRWAAHFLAGDYLTGAYYFVYDSDHKTWGLMLAAVRRLSEKGEILESGAQKILARAFAIGHPDAERTLTALAEAGYSPERLAQARNAA